MLHSFAERSPRNFHGNRLPACGPNGGRGGVRGEGARGTPGPLIPTLVPTRGFPTGRAHPVARSPPFPAVEPAAWDSPSSLPIEKAGGPPTHGPEYEGMKGQKYPSVYVGGGGVFAAPQTAPLPRPLLLPNCCHPSITPLLAPSIAGRGFRIALIRRDRLFENTVGQRDGSMETLCDSVGAMMRQAKGFVLLRREMCHLRGCRRGGGDPRGRCGVPDTLWFQSNCGREMK